MRTMTLTVLNTNGNTAPSPYTITVPKHGKCEDLIQALGIACSLGADETLLVAEVYCYVLIFGQLSFACDCFSIGDYCIY